MENNSDKCKGMYAAFKINNFCNFNCPYCFIPKSQRKNKGLIGNNNIEDIINFFDSSKQKWHILITGGEPFLSPRFIELCIGLTKNHIIEMNTNLSSNKIYEFVEKINPKQVGGINWSVHITEIERLKIKKILIKKFHLLKKRGFNISASLVAWPYYLQKNKSIIKWPVSEKKLIRIYNEFKKNKINLRVYPFLGVYNGKMYPESYSKEDLKLILNLHKKSLRDEEHKLPLEFLEKNSKIIRGHISFNKMLCKAGVNYVGITENGDVKRCHSDCKILGNIYKNKNIKYLKNPSLCNNEFCGCYWEGIYSAIGKPKTVCLGANDKFHIPV